MSTRRPLRRLLVLVAVGLPPWTVIQWSSGTGANGYGAYFAYGIGDVAGPLGPHFTPLPTYVSQAVLNAYWLQAWPTAAFLYGCALASAALALVGREDRRVTAGLLAMAGASAGLHATGLVVHNARLAVLPLGTLLLWTAALALYRDALRRLIFVRPEST
ncbi:TIGR04206 family protein [Halarchaeum grantii]|uniref:TIGR04206 family protein n=1 Tax=Halarchaeum grantii TaxID=1193105 RepID=UPI00166B6346|nr:TIGR04206 family protein [Halarchaeum grantii]